jgi:beta-mannosidase
MTAASAVSDVRRRRHLRWMLAAAPSGHDGPLTHDEPLTWVPAQVPGTAQHDWLAASGSPVDLFDNEMPAYFKELEGFRWHYRARLGRYSSPAYIVILGVDFKYSVSIDGRTLLETRGMYTEHSVSLPTDAEFIEIVIEPPPVDQDPPVPGPLWEWTRDRRGQARRATRPLVSYGDDYQPRVLTAGPWRDIYLEERPNPHFADYSVQASLTEDLAVGHLTVTTRVTGEVPIDGSLRLLLTPYLPSGQSRSSVVFDDLDWSIGERTLALSGPLPWWPWELGDQWLYHVELQLVAGSTVIDLVRDQVAFRRVELVAHEGAWEETDPEGYPKSRVEPPQTLRVNGRPMFLKGTCMTPPSLFPHEGGPALYDPLVNVVRSMNFNLIKNSGGGIVHKESFYHCDRAGIMVWQDFPLSCNEYPEDKAYLDLLAAEATAIVRRLRRHPSVVVWCGGNELFTPWSRMTEQHAALRLLNMITFQHDPHTPFMGSTPQQGASHGYYMFANPDQPMSDGLSYLRQARSTAYMEVACPAPATAARLRHLIPGSALWPPVDDPAWRLRSAWNAWDGRLDTWLCSGLVQRVAGECADIEEFVASAQLMQAALLQQVVEEARRQQPRCSAICIWALNEPWPNAANLSITCYPAEPKLAVHWLAAAARPALLSLRVPKLQWRTGEPIHGEVWLLDDSHPAKRRITSWVVEVRDSAERVLDEVSGCTPPGQPLAPARQVGRFQFPVPAVRAGERRTFSLTVRGAEDPELDSNYTLFIPSRAEVP